MNTSRVQVRQPPLSEWLHSTGASGKALFVVLAALCALVLLVLEMTVLAGPHPLLAYRGVVGRPMVQTARHLLPPHPSFRVGYHSQYHPAFLRDLGISAAQVSRALEDMQSVRNRAPDRACDDGVANLKFDWQESESPGQCGEEKRGTEPSTAPQIECQRHLPDDLPLKQVCMNQSLMYDPGVPTYGHHRPLLPVYGTYRYIPPQRWLHSIDHGAVVFLYHPCAHPERVHRLTQLVRNCVYKHIVTPSLRVPRERPLVLVAHGCEFSMSRIFVELVVAFIRAHALHGKDGNSNEDGKFDSQLLEAAQPPDGSDVRDTSLCPFYPPKTAADTLFHQDHGGSV